MDKPPEADHTSAKPNLTLMDLPPEVFLKICSYLHAKFIVTVLGRVCTAFHELFKDDITWKIRISKQWPKKYPPVSVDEDMNFNWIEACMQREEQYRLWSNVEQNMEHFKIGSGCLYGGVDSVHLMQNGSLLAAGSRDRYLTLWDLNNRDNKPVVSLKAAHQGWIWSITSLDETLCTGSWDKYVKLWDIGQGYSEKSKFKCKAAILCTHYESNEIIASSYDKCVYHIDPRSERISNQKYHKMAVLCLAVDDRFIITGSEDNTIVVFDRRAEKIYKTLQLDNYPMCMSYGLGQLWVGDKLGQVTLLDVTTYGDFEIVDTYDVGHMGKLTGIKHSLGSVITSSMDKTIKILEPNVEPDAIATLTSHTMDIAGISFQNDVLASAGSDVSIGIWRPKNATYSL